MDAMPPSIPPTLPTVQCVVAASRAAGIPVEVTLGIMKTEGGRPGMRIVNKNKTVDMGVMQVNTVWLEDYAKKTGAPKKLIEELAVNNGCFSVSLALDILKGHLDRERDLARAVAAYHSRTPGIGDAYLKRFMNNLHAVRNGNLPPLLAYR